ncbi:hypothetical protein D9615_009286 [Tricholomella constricta]|uniref:PHP domain-like protein n=1 Tax=Tricholomella constricta TaxID=117010 RepID=A0A8H5GWI3_9AGAR|nr:hypothetical protein D9615_009286 [Tricholomella constricta]
MSMNIKVVRWVVEARRDCSWEDEENENEARAKAWQFFEGYHSHPTPCISISTYPFPTSRKPQLKGPQKKGKESNNQHPAHHPEAHLSHFPHLKSAESKPASTSSLNGLYRQVGYTVIAFNQVVHKKVDPKIHVNTAESLVRQLRNRPGLVYLKRLSIILDEDSEKGFGLTNANASLFPSYDLIGLVPLTQTSFALACLTHSMPSPLTAHIISLPLTLPRLAFHLKHTLIRTAIKNGAVFEISYVGALGGENEPVLVNAGAAENGAPAAKRNWWAAAKELVRVTKGKSVVVSGGVVSEADLRAPSYGRWESDHAAWSRSRCGTRQSDKGTEIIGVTSSDARSTYRAVFSEPTVIIPEGTAHSAPAASLGAGDPTPASDATGISSQSAKKRPRAEEAEAGLTGSAGMGTGDAQKKRRRKNKGNQLAQG